MKGTDREDFAALMLGLGETYGEPVSDARMEIYFAALEDVPLSSIRAAATAHVRTSKFFPRPAELREAITGPLEDLAEVAWLAVVALVRRVGYYRMPALEDWPDEQARRVALELFGGWKALCELLPAAGTPEFLGTAKQFKAAYAARERQDQRLELNPSKEEARAKDRKSVV